MEFHSGEWGSSRMAVAPVVNGEAVSPIYAYPKAGTYVIYANVFDAAGAFWGQARIVKVAPRPGQPGDIPTDPGEPSLESITPDHGPRTGGTPVTIKGQHIGGANLVQFGFANAPPPVTVDDETITTVTPQSIGIITIPHTVFVHFPDGRPTLQNLLFRYEDVPVPPTLVSIAPNTGSGNGLTPVVLTGTGFIGATSIAFGPNNGTGMVVDSATQIRCNTPPGEGTVVVGVRHPLGRVDLVDGFTYLALDEALPPLPNE